MSEKRPFNVKSVPGTPRAEPSATPFKPYGTVTLVTRERLIELLEELYEKWDFAVAEYSSASEKPAAALIRAEVKELIAKLKSGELKITKAAT